MPRAVIDVTPQRYELRSCPGGWVDLRRMSYDKWLHRTDMALQMQIEMEERRGRNGKAGSRKADMKMQNQAVTTYELANCIIDHNLDDENDQKLDFRSPRALQILDPRVGNEIADLIKTLHEPLSEEEEGNSVSSFSPS